MWTWSRLRWVVQCAAQSMKSLSSTRFSFLYQHHTTYHVPASPLNKESSDLGVTMAHHKGSRSTIRSNMYQRYSYQRNAYHVSEKKFFGLCGCTCNDREAASTAFPLQQAFEQETTSKYQYSCLRLHETVRLYSQIVTQRKKRLGWYVNRYLTTILSAHFFNFCWTGRDVHVILSVMLSTLCLYWIASSWANSCLPFFLNQGTSA